MERKAVVTGMGVVTPVGNNCREFLAALREGRDGSGPVLKFNADNFPVRRACEVRGFESDSPRDPFIQYALRAAREAVEDSGIDLSALDPCRFGLVVSSSKGGMTSFEKGRFEDFPPDRLNFYLARELNARGPVKCVIAACATGTYSIIEGVRLVESGDADFVLAGASDASITPLMLAGYHQMGVYSKDGMCPYDARRSGFLVGEGAGVVALETREHAAARGARIYGEVAGCAESSDSYHYTAFDPDADELCYLLGALFRRGGVVPADVDYLNTHGTSTRAGDLYETKQIKKAFGRDAYNISCSSTKSMVGHMLGASGAVEFVASALALRENFIPPTIHYEKTDPDCDLDYTPNRARDRRVELACSISLGFGGHLGGILIRK